MWSALLAAAVGLAVIAAPALLSYQGLAADVAHVVGPLATMFGVVAAAQVTRSVRWVNVATGAALLASAVALDAPARAAWAHAIAGASLVLLARRRGSMPDALGGGWAALRSRPPA